jgi:hypothetical protein
MKLHASMVITLVGISVGILAACNHPKKSNDWRSPAPPLKCTTDADCRGGTCAIELGAAQGTGTCTAAPLAPLPGTDGGTRPGPGPGPNVQPSSSDIQI